jgi:hypothetical protein
MTSQKNKPAQSEKVIAKIDVLLDKTAHAAGADMAKLHLRQDKDLNAAHPLNETVLPPKLPRKGD